MTKEYSDFLAHYGVKGQRHGIRRYQNEDGTLTPEGRAHYGVGDKRSEADLWRKDDAKRLSDEELNRRNTRMQREQQYRQNIENRNETSKLVRNAAKTLLLGTAVGVATTIMRKNYTKWAEKGGSFIKKLAKRSVNFVRTRRIQPTGGAEYYTGRRAMGGAARRFIIR